MSVSRPPGFRFPPASKLKRNKDFARLKKTGQRMAHSCLLANWRVPGETPGVRLGVVSSSRLGGAVERNRARRLMREAFRLHRNELVDSADIVLVARASINGRSSADVGRDFMALAQKAGLLKRAGN